VTTTDKKNKKQEILEAASQLFREKGYAAASIRDLALKVGLEPSSIYSHIESKEELLVTICLNCADRFTAGMKEISESESSPKKKLKKLIKLHLEIAYNDPTSVAVFSDEWKHLPESAMIPFMRSRKEYATQFKSILKEGKHIEQFQFADDEIVFNIIINALRWTYFATEKPESEKLYEAISKFILNGLNNN
jgi:TetR/AcrR family transcriptional regulator, cholesterol catabolism regulator